MNGGINLPARVDALMGSPKRIAGVSDWRDTDYVGQRRWQSPMVVNGEVTNLILQVNYFPAFPTFRFHILLIYQCCVTRLDYSSLERHNNHVIKGVATPANVMIGMIMGPHFHSWADNRATVKGFNLPKELEFAIFLPKNVQGFDNAFRWFCGQTNVQLGTSEIPMLPERDRLV